MNRAEPHNELSSRFQAIGLMGSARLFACVIVMLMANSVPAVLADVQINERARPTGQVSLSNVTTNERVTAVRHKARYHSGVMDLELEQAVSRAAGQYRVQPALLLAVMKAESSFNPTVISKAGAVGLMQLIPETAIRHGVHYLYDTNENVTGGAKHLRYLLDRFHGNIRLALAAYNAGERKVDRYGKIPPYKETQDYVKKVLLYYRSYKKDCWIMPLVMTDASTHAGRPY
jgi:soluble lytic murein transglycosylase-like protein